MLRQMLHAHADAAMAASQGLPPGAWDPNAQALPPAPVAEGEAGPDHSLFKNCPTCHEVKNAAMEFRPVNSSPDGYALTCRACEAVRSCLSPSASDPSCCHVFCAPARGPTVCLSATRLIRLCVSPQEAQRMAQQTERTGQPPTEKACSKCHQVRGAFVAMHSCFRDG